MSNIWLVCCGDKVKNSGHCNFYGQHYSYPLLILLVNSGQVHLHVHRPFICQVFCKRFPFISRNSCFIGKTKWNKTNQKGATFGVSVAYCCPPCALHWAPRVSLVSTSTQCPRDQYRTQCSCGEEASVRSEFYWVFLHRLWTCGGSGAGWWQKDLLIINFDQRRSSDHLWLLGVRPCPPGRNDPLLGTGCPVPPSPLGWMRVAHWPLPQTSTATYLFIFVCFTHTIRSFRLSTGYMLKWSNRLYMKVK